MDLMRVYRVAKILDVSKKRVYQMIHEGKLEAVRLGPRCLRVKRTSLDAYLNASRYRPEEDPSLGLPPTAEQTSSRLRKP